MAPTVVEVNNKIVAIIYKHLFSCEIFALDVQLDDKTLLDKYIETSSLKIQYKNKMTKQDYDYQVAILTCNKSKLDLVINFLTKIYIENNIEQDMNEFNALMRNILLIA